MSYDKSSKSDKSDKSSYTVTDYCKVFKGRYYYPWFWSIGSNPLAKSTRQHAVRAQNPEHPGHPGYEQDNTVPHALEHMIENMDSPTDTTMKTADWSLMHYLHPREKTREKILVFDFDETLGCFGDLYILWSGIRHIYPRFDHFDELFDLYPEFLRYGMLTILEYLYKKKCEKKCKKIMIYTNNQCSTEWVKQVTNSIQSRVIERYRTPRAKHASRLRRDHATPHPLFDQLICAFKIHNKPIEPKRTSHRKTMGDFLNCTMMTRDVEICFVDDVEHEDMKNSRVYYICPLPYYHPLTAEDIVDRFIQSGLITYNPSKKPLLHMRDFWIPWFSSYKRAFEHKRVSHTTLKEDLKVSETLMHHIRDFIEWTGDSVHNLQKTATQKGILVQKPRHVRQKSSNNNHNTKKKHSTTPSPHHRTRRKI